MFDPIAYVLAKKKILATQKKYDSNLDGIIDLASIPAIPRSKLEYTTENVSLAYLAAINRINFDVATPSPRYHAIYVMTSDSFTDKAVKSQCADYTGLVGRLVDLSNYYESFLDATASTSDFFILAIINGSYNILASESVDFELNTSHLLKFSISGSTIKGYRNDMGTPKISATDTTFSSGMYGVLQGTVGGYHSTDGILGILLAPSSPLPPAKKIVEAEIIGSGSGDDPVRPNQRQELVEISKLANAPGFLRREAKRYELLKAKGFTDEEIRALLGYIPQHRVDLASVTWGVFDHKPQHSTMIITITADNPYQEGAILKQAEHAKAKNLRVMNPPRDYREAIEQYRQLKRDFPEWIVGKDNYAYQTLGLEVLEAFQAADFYYGELVEHRTHYHQLKTVPDWEMRRTLAMWRRRLEGASGLNEERERHLKKLDEVERLGW